MNTSMDPLSRVLLKILNSNPDLKKGVHEARILELWAPAIGEQIAKHAKAVQVKGKILFLSVDHPIWKQELHSNKRLALQKFNTKLAEELGKPDGRETWIEEIFFLGSTNETLPKVGKGFRKK